MADLVHIERLHAAYQLPAAASGRRAALDRAHREVATRALVRAAAALSLPADAIVCVRELRVPVRLGAEASEPAWVEAWTVQLLAALRAAATGAARDPGVVAFSSDFAARRDALLGAVAGQLDRAWAWRQAGVVQREAPAQEVLRDVVAAFLRAPHEIVRVVAELSQRGALAAALFALPPAAWRRLALAARAAHAGAPRPGGATVSRGTAARSRSAIWAALEAAAPVFSAARPATEAAAVLLCTVELALLEVAPAVAVSDHARFDMEADAWLVELGATLSGQGSVLARAGPRTDLAGAAAPAEASVQKAPRARRSPPSSDERAGATGSPEISAAPSARAPAESAALEGAPRAAREAAEAAAERALFEPPPTPATTEVGGLIFVLRLLARLDLPTSAARDPVTRDRPFDVVLHHLGRALSGAAPEDSGVMAFSGHPPETEPPSVAPPDDRLSAWLADVTPRLAEAAAEAVGDDLSPADLAGTVGETRARRVLDWVIRRRAEVSGARGWLEVTFELASVSVPLRRAGLDLTLGWVPFLGTVVEVRYA